MGFFIIQDVLCRRLRFRVPSSVFCVLEFLKPVSAWISVSLTVYWLFYVWYWIGYGLVLVWKGILFHIHLISIYMPYIFIDIWMYYGKYMVDIWMLYGKHFQTKTKPLPIKNHRKNICRTKINKLVQICTQKTKYF